MKSLILSILLTLPLMGFNQVNSEKVSDSTTVKVGNRKFKIHSDSSEINITIRKTDEDENGNEDVTIGKKEKKADVDLFAYDVGINFPLWYGSANLPSGIQALETVPGKSWTASCHFFPTRISLYKNKLNLKTALTLDAVDYGLRYSTTLVKGTNQLIWTNDTLSFSKNKLKTTYLQLPLMLNFESNADRHKSFHISVGGYAGFLVGSRTKQKSEERGKVVTQDDFSLEKFRYGLTARIGYSFLTVFANYNLSPLFHKNQGPELQTLTIGLNIIPF